MNLQEALESTPKPYIKHFRIWTGTKWRNVAEPREPLKTALKELNKHLGDLYEQLLISANLEQIPQAYRKNRSVKNNAAMHAKNQIWYRYDFSGFYDSVRFEDFAEYLHNIIPNIKSNEKLYRDCFIDPKTKGLTQGSPTSGVLAGIACLRLWTELQKHIPEATITQYSDDLCISGTTRPHYEITNIIIKSIRNVGLQIKLNQKKTRIDFEQHRRLTGVSCNAQNQLTPRRTDYRNMRSLFYNIRKYGHSAIPSDITASKILGRLTFMSHIDESGKIKKLQNNYADIIEILKSMQKTELGGN